MLCRWRGFVTYRGGGCFLGGSQEIQDRHLVRGRCTSEQCACGICGKEKQVIGYEASEVLDVEPAKYFVQVTKREKRACKGCEEGGVSCAPLQDRIIEKGLGSDRVVIDAVINVCLSIARV
jgi:transposase